jgi:hypothetical protein
LHALQLQQILREKQELKDKKIMRLAPAGIDPVCGITA